jgi:hemin uptake protein HemP
MTTKFNHFSVRWETQRDPSIRQLNQVHEELKLRVQLQTLNTNKEKHAERISSTNSEFEQKSNNIPKPIPEPPKTKTSGKYGSLPDKRYDTRSSLRSSNINQPSPSPVSSVSSKQAPQTQNATIIPTQTASYSATITQINHQTSGVIDHSYRPLSHFNEDYFLALETEVKLLKLQLEAERRAKSILQKKYYFLQRSYKELQKQQQQKQFQRILKMHPGS